MVSIAEGLVTLITKSFMLLLSTEILHTDGNKWA
jgi:hypothetical protein